MCLELSIERAPGLSLVHVGDIKLNKNFFQLNLQKEHVQADRGHPELAGKGNFRAESSESSLILASLHVKKKRPF